MIIGIIIHDMKMTTIFFRGPRNNLIVKRYHRFVNGFRNKSVGKIEKINYRNEAADEKTDRHLLCQANC